MMKGKVSTIVIYIDGLFVSGGCLNLRSGVIFPIGESAPNQKEKRIAWSQVSAASKGMLLHCFDQKTGVDFAHAFWIGIGYGFRGD